MHFYCHIYWDFMFSQFFSFWLIIGSWERPARIRYPCPISQCIWKGCLRELSRTTLLNNVWECSSEINIMYSVFLLCIHVEGNSIEEKRGWRQNLPPFSSIPIDYFIFLIFFLVSFRFDWFRFVFIGSVSFRLVSFWFRFALYWDPAGREAS
jgi:hypothetical protein